jgi:hypothetical protein
VAVQSVWETGLTTPANAVLAALAAAIVVHRSAPREVERLTCRCVWVRHRRRPRQLPGRLPRRGVRIVRGEIDDFDPVDTPEGESPLSPDVRRVWDFIAKTPNWWMEIDVRAGTDRAAVQPDRAAGWRSSS